MASDKPMSNDEVRAALPGWVRTIWDFRWEAPPCVRISPDEVECLCRALVEQLAEVEWLKANQPPDGHESFTLRHMTALRNAIFDNLIELLDGRCGDDDLVAAPRRVAHIVCALKEEVNRLKAKRPQAHEGGSGAIAKTLAGLVALPDYLDGSLAEFTSRLATRICELQKQPNFDGALMTLLCDAGRVAWEAAQRPRVFELEAEVERLTAEVVAATAPGWRDYYAEHRALKEEVQRLKTEAGDAEHG